MTDEQFSQLKADEEAAYAAYDEQLNATNPLGAQWLLLKQKLDRENMRREILAEEAAALKSIPDHELA